MGIFEDAFKKKKKKQPTKVQEGKRAARKLMSQYGTPEAKEHLKKATKRAGRLKRRRVVSKVKTEFMESFNRPSARKERASIKRQVKRSARKLWKKLVW